MQQLNSAHSVIDVPQTGFWIGSRSPTLSQFKTYSVKRPQMMRRRVAWNWKKNSVTQLIRLLDGKLGYSDVKWAQKKR
jgi:hypothetical protein